MTKSWHQHTEWAKVVCVYTNITLSNLTAFVQFSTWNFSQKIRQKEEIKSM